MSDTNLAPVFTVGSFELLDPNPFADLASTFDRAPALADLDGDGDLDLVVGERYGTLLAYRNTDGTFAPILPSPLPFIDVNFLAKPAFADLDGDGDLDVVVGGTFGILQVSWNNAGSFAPFSTIPFSGLDVGYNSAPAFADIDGDGDLDAVVGTNDGLVRTWRNDLGTFTELTSTDNPFDGIDVGYRSAPAFADLDGDGDLDLVVGANDGLLRAWENNGGTFTELTSTDNPFAGVDVGDRSTPTFADIDGDGDLDLVVGRYRGTLQAYENLTPSTAVTFSENATGTVFQGAAEDPEGETIQWFLDGADAVLFQISDTGAVTFSAPPDFEVPQDADGDNVYDLTVIAADSENETRLDITVSVTNVNELPFFVPGPFVPFPASTLAGLGTGMWPKLAFGDLDGDGDLDAVVGGFDGSLRGFERTATGWQALSPDLFAGIAASGGFSAPALGDLVGDDRLDLVVGSNSGPIRLYERTDAGFVLVADNPFASVPGLSPSSPTLADLDDDGDLDLVAGSADGTLRAFRNDNGTFVAFPDDPFAGLDVGSNSSPALGDLDGDGDLDLVLGNFGPQPIAYENTGSAQAPGPFVAYAFNPFGAVNVFEYSAPAFADLDGDGDGDLVVSGVSGNLSGPVVALENLTPPTAVTFAENATGTVLQRAVVDPDGTTILWSLEGADARFFTIDGTGAVRFKAPPSFEAPGDADGDNTYDLSIIASDGVNATSLPISVTVTDVDEAPVFAPGTQPYVPLASNPLVGVAVGNFSTPSFGDIDNDGDQDLVVGANDGTLRTWENSGTGFVALEGDDNPLAGIDVGFDSRAAFADLDGDGDLDLVSGAYDGTLRTYRNDAGAFTELLFDDNPFDGFFVGQRSGPAFTDLDSDGDLDLVLGDQEGNVTAYRNTGAGFEEFAENPFAGIDVDFTATPTFADLDGDGDPDLVVGANDGTLRAFRNDAGAFTELLSAANPFAGIGGGPLSAPAFGDLDGDGSLELVVGSFFGTLQSFRSSTAVTVSENATGIVFQRGAVDPDGTAIQWSLAGADAALFDISSTGAVTFKAAPDFEAPGDQGGNNVYELTVIASDGTLSTPLAITVTVTDVGEAPAITSGTTASFAENATGPAYQATATDPDGTAIQWSLDGADAALFQISSTGAVTFKVAPNFEAPQDADKDNTYDLSVIASDGTLSTSLAITVTVTDAAENRAPDARDDARAVNEDATVTGNVVAGDAFGGVADTDPDAGTTLTVTEVDGQTAGVGTAVAGDWGTLVLNANGSYSYVADADALDLLSNGATRTDSFTYQVSDGQGGLDTATLTLTVTAINDSGTLTGSNGRDTLTGDNRDELIRGLNGNDILRGNGGADQLLGGNGDDRLEGGAGIDTLNGEAGSDQLLGEAGADTFVISRTAGLDTILDFAPEDTIRIIGFRRVDGFEDLAITTSGTTTRVAWSDGAVLLADLAQPLVADDFVFV